MLTVAVHLNVTLVPRATSPPGSMDKITSLIRKARERSMKKRLDMLYKMLCGANVCFERKTTDEKAATLDNAYIPEYFPFNQSVDNVKNICTVYAYIL